MTSDGFNIYYKIDARELSLPKWVQEHIESLRRSIRTLKEAIDQDVADSDTFIHDNYSVPPEPIGKGTRIVFKTQLNESRWPREFEVRMKDGVLEVSSTSSLNLRLNASNRMEIRTDE